MEEAIPVNDRQSTIELPVLLAEQSEWKAVVKALEIHLVLKNILQNLSKRDLLTCRRVNSSWNDLATSLLLAPPGISGGPSICTSLRFRYHLAKTTFFLDPRYHPASTTINPRPLNDLVDLLKRSQSISTLIPIQFPCHSFEFSDGPLNDPGIQQLLHTFGKKIRSLTLDLVSHPWGDDENLVQLLLLHQAPNLSVLSVTPPKQIRPSNSTQCHSQRSPLTLALPATNQFPNLVYLTGVDMTADFIENICTMAKNLRFISIPLESDSLDLLTFLQRSQRQHIVKNLYFCPRQSDKGDGLEPISKIIPQLGLKLSSLEVDLTRTSVRNPWATKILIDLLHSTASTLEKFTCRLPLIDNSQRFWPVLRRVTELHLTLWESEGFLLENLALGEKFPNLQCVKFLCKYFSNARLWPSPFSGVASTVSRIEISEFVFPEGYLRLLPYFSTSFPNLQELTVEGIEDLSKIGEALWTCSKLRVLHMDLKFNPANKALNVDSTITGFSRETCGMLHENESVTVEEAETYRVNPSILDLKELEELNIKIVVSNEVSHFHRVMSHVSGKYGFDLLPRLRDKVIISLEFRPWGQEIDMEKYNKVQIALAEISPFVNIIN